MMSISNFTAEHAKDAEEKINALTRSIIGAAMEVHRILGPGLLESTYEQCLLYELAERGIRFEHQKPLPVIYKKNKLDCGYRLDVIVEGEVIVEVKAVASLSAIFQAQLMTYLKLSGCKVGLLINFNVELLKDGVCRMVNNL
jgi:GxxExxY protein